MHGDQRLELTDDIGVTAQRQVCLDASSTAPSRSSSSRPISTCANGSQPRSPSALPRHSCSAARRRVAAWPGALPASALLPCSTSTVVAGNHATAIKPDGRFAEGAAIFAGYSGFGPAGGTNALAFEDSDVAGNSAILSSDFPRFFGGQFQDLVANSGGIVAGPGVSSTTVGNTLMADNSAIATDLNGEPSAIDAAMNVSSGSLTMTNTVISGNRAITNSSTSADVGPAGSALEVDGGGTISNTRITGNYATMVSPHGAAAVNGALGLFGNTSLLTVRDSTISGNAATATSTTGSVSVQGAGVFNDGLLTLIDDSVAGNSGTATGPSGEGLGGGIWNGTTFTGPPVRLTVQDTAVTRNSLTGSRGVKLRGGGLFTAPPATVVLADSVIELNIPDQCVGC
jgi:hypothetical protein